MEEATKLNIKETLTILQKKSNSELYAILDGALIENLEMKLAESMNEKEYVSLYKGTKYDHLQEVAPYLVNLNSEHPILDWWMEQGWDKYWGVLCTTGMDLQSLATHFKKFLTVKDYNDNEVLFRFYDPRVFGVFITTCSDENYFKFEGAVNHFCLEDEKSGFKVINKRVYPTVELDLG